jgi:hypothetical protein
MDSSGKGAIIAEKLEIDVKKRDTRMERRQS